MVSVCAVYVYVYVCILMHDRQRHASINVCVTSIYVCMYHTLENIGRRNFGEWYIITQKISPPMLVNSDALVKYR